MPRPILENIGITYRRVPVISIGKDVYIDNHITLPGLQAAFKDKALPEGPMDFAFETFGYVSPLAEGGLEHKYNGLTRDRDHSGWRYHSFQQA